MVETPDGEMAPAWRYDATNAFKGYELLGKHLKLFTDKSEITGKGGKDLAPPRIEIVNASKDAG